MDQSSELLRLKEKGDQTLGTRDKGQGTRDKGSTSKVVLALKMMSSIKAD